MSELTDLLPADLQRRIRESDLERALHAINDRYLILSDKIVNGDFTEGELEKRANELSRDLLRLAVRAQDK